MTHLHLCMTHPCQTSSLSIHQGRSSSLATSSHSPHWKRLHGKAVSSPACLYVPLCVHYVCMCVKAHVWAILGVLRCHPSTILFETGVLAGSDPQSTSAAQQATCSSSPALGFLGACHHAWLLRCAFQGLNQGCHPYMARALWKEAPPQPFPLCFEWFKWKRLKTSLMFL